MKYTAKQITDWRSYERVRKSGKYNMLDADARRATGLDRNEYVFVLKHYVALREAVDGKRDYNRGFATAADDRARRDRKMKGGA